MLPTIAVVEDDADLRASLVDYLAIHQYPVWAVDSAESFYRQLAINPIDILILDIGLPGESGLDLIGHIGTCTDFHIIVLSAISNPQEKVYALKHGADRYLTKPVYFEELIANVEAIWRTNPKKNKRSLLEKDLTSWLLVCEDHQLITPNEITIELTHSESILLCCLAEYGGECLREAVLAAFGHKETDGDYQRMDVMLSRLRKKVRTLADITLPLSAIPVNRLSFSARLTKQ